jgi:hypothetical protein
MILSLTFLNRTIKNYLLHQDPLHYLVLRYRTLSNSAFQMLRGPHLVRQTNSLALSLQSKLMEETRAAFLQLGGEFQVAELQFKS